MIKKNILLLTPLMVAMLSGCAATQVALSKKNLDVQTKMSATLFLEPADTDAKKKIYVQVKNTSAKQDFQIAEDLKGRLMAKGYTIVPTMKQAHYLLQVNVLQVGKSSETAAEAAFYKGYGMDGVALGAGTAYVAGVESDRALVGAGMLGGIGTVVADSLVKDVYFSVITDLQIKERMPGKKKAYNTAMHYNESGTSGGTWSSYSEDLSWKISQTRVLSSANKVNLSFERAAPVLKEDLVNSISNVF